MKDDVVQMLIFQCLMSHKTHIHLCVMASMICGDGRLRPCSWALSIENTKK